MVSLEHTHTHTHWLDCRLFGAAHVQVPATATTAAALDRGAVDAAWWPGKLRRGGGQSGTSAQCAQSSSSQLAQPVPADCHEPIQKAIQARPTLPCPPPSCPSPPLWSTERVVLQCARQTDRHSLTHSLEQTPVQGKGACALHSLATAATSTRLFIIAATTTTTTTNSNRR